MRHVPPLVVDDKRVYAMVTRAKQSPRRGQLLGARLGVLAAYDAYARSAPDLAHLPAVALTDAQKEALIHAYTVETQPFVRLRERLTKRVILAECPFCGLSEASTLDHYLPKELHPQFAIYSRNLIPCCASCNTKKNQLVVDEETDIRLFLHPYFDQVPVEDFVRAGVRLWPNALSLSFGLRRPPNFPNAAFQHLTSHFRLLGLADRYRKMSLAHLRDERAALRRYYGRHHNAAKVAAELTQSAIDLEATSGPNHWRVVLYRALAAHNAFCDGGFAVLDRIQ
jgi:5-methylcytosine-specific restriction endonuclease McrA